MSNIKTMVNILCLMTAVISLAACTSNTVVEGKIPFLEKLSKAKGEFVWNAKLTRHIYSKMEVIEKIAAPENPDELVAVLVNCIDDATPSNSILNGKNVSLGVICYQALSQTAYYESTDSTGDIKTLWSGHILPTASSAELQRAKHAWVDVVNSKSYILY
ncbi:hypothetical protein MNBD_GAMMA26-1575 [hydrothermal vent metagenome]|uniref:Lipoprotein n=1 Tax=hydrothermal vent metagenome TaxID=652676 RepID=A0A3B1BL54_9ZZZZ